MGVLSTEDSVTLSEALNQWWALNISLDNRNELTENVGPINHPIFWLNFFTVWIKQFLCQYVPFYPLKLIVWI